MLGRGTDPQPTFRVSQAGLEPWSPAAWPTLRGQAWAVGGSFQLRPCLGKILFHVAACDLSRQLCRRGMGGLSREKGEALSIGHPRPLHKAHCSLACRECLCQRLLQLLTLALPCHRWPWPVLAGMSTGVGWILCQPGWGSRDSASLDLFVCQPAAQAWLWGLPPPPAPNIGALGPKLFPPAAPAWLYALPYGNS